MATIDVDKLLQPVSDDAPCGENLEYDPAFGELERTARGQAEHVMGDQKIEAEEPRWDEVFELAESLFERTRDLRVAIYLTRAALNLSGLPAFADGMRVIAGLTRDFWAGVFPELDADDNNDPTLRINSLIALNSREGLVRDLARVPLVVSRAVGRFGLREIQMASGEMSAPEGQEAPDAALIDAAFMDCDVDGLRATADAVSQAAESLKEMQAFILDQVGSQFAPDLGQLTGELAKMQRVLAEKLAARGVGEEPAEAGADGEAAGAPGAAPAAASGEIRSREDAIRAIDRLSEYFRRNEPSSPVPLLLERAKRLVAKDFLEILRDLAPEGLSSVERIGGFSSDN